MGIKERLIQFIEYLGISRSAFERKCKLSNGFVDKANDKIRESSLQMIANAYPELNLVWLQTGYGEMLYHSKAIMNEVRESSPGYVKISPTSTDNENRLIDIIEKLRETLKSQQETIKIQSETIRKLISK